MADLQWCSENVVNPAVFADETRLHDTFAVLRAQAPVHWTDVKGIRPFWSVTKHSDIMEIERQNDRFLNDPRLTIQTIETERKVEEFTGGQRLLRSLVDMDDPDHRKYRALTQGFFSAPALRAFEPRLKVLAQRSIDKMAQRGLEGEIDFVNDVAVWYPLRGVMSILGVPEQDEPLMLKLTQELFGATDPDFLRNQNDNTSVITDFFNYFNQITADRRAHPKDDVASTIANARIDGDPIGDLEAMSYYIIVATAGHDTTSSSISGGLRALIENPEEFRKLKQDRSLLPSAVDEMIRWVTPVKHFFRTATQDYELRGTHIKAGDNLVMWYVSGNRDEEVFGDPFTFRIDRKPNPHIAFGYGVHHCLGNVFAKMEMRAIFEELLDRLEWAELAGDPKLVQATFVSGLKNLPIRYRLSR